MPSFKFLQSLRPDKDNRQFVVIGLGRFGRAVCGTLHSLGYEVMGTDVDEKQVSQALTDRIASHTLEIDSTDPIALKQAGIFEMDTAIVAIGNYVQESIITTLNLKEAGVKHIIAKASSDIHGRLLEKVGADRVVYPEKDAGTNLAYNLTKPAIIERFDLDPEHSIVELKIPEEFHGKTLAELELRKNYGLSVLALSSGQKFQMNPTPQEKLNKNSIMVVLGSNADIQKLPI
jgi:trk system potassium uptake protein